MLIVVQIYRLEFIMQHQLGKIFNLAFFLLAFLASPALICADDIDLIKKADTYFEQKKFIEALKIYEILASGPKFKPIHQP